MATIDRDEFPVRVKRQAYERAKQCCENCGVDLADRKKAFDHVLPARLGGLGTLENCRVLCLPCHKEKTKDDVARMAKADAQKNAATGIKSERRAIPQRAKPPKQTSKLESIQALPRRWK